jgi:4a-hydroxytetrahydrobiopterin dehydratase
MSELADQQCVACRGGEPTLTGDEVAFFGKQVEGWTPVENHHIEKRYTFPDFQHALALVNRFGEIAEEQGHHPVIRFSWGWAEVSIWTHKIDGITVSDFILAAKFDRAARALGATVG